MNKWDKVVVDISQNAFSGQCPFCKNDSAHYAVKIILQKEKAGFVELFCDSCGERDFYDVRNWNENIPKEG